MRTGCSPSFSAHSTLKRDHFEVQIASKTDTKIEALKNNDFLTVTHPEKARVPPQDLDFGVPFIHIYIYIDTKKFNVFRYDANFPPQPPQTPVAHRHFPHPHPPILPPSRVRGRGFDSAS